VARPPTEAPLGSVHDRLLNAAEGGAASTQLAHAGPRQRRLGAAFGSVEDGAQQLFLRRGWPLPRLRLGELTRKLAVAVDQIAGSGREIERSGRILPQRRRRQRPRRRLLLLLLLLLLPLLLWLIEDAQAGDGSSDSSSGSGGGSGVIIVGGKTQRAVNALFGDIAFNFPLDVDQGLA
jgi:predicted nucleic acid-binding Zn ribbon protein